MDKRKVLQFYYDQLLDLIGSRNLPGLYYKNGLGIHVFTIPEKDEEKIAKKIYSSQNKVIKKFPKVDFTFRIVPKYNSTISSIVPPDFKRFRASRD